MRSKIKSNRIYLTGEIQHLARTVKFISSDGDVYDFSKDELEEDVIATLPTQGKKISNVRAVLSNDGNKLYGLKPNDGVFVVQFIEFAHAKDQPPTWKIQEGRDVARRDGRGTFWMAEKAVCTLVLEILHDNWQGVGITYQLDYIFEPDDANPRYTILNGSKGIVAKWNEFLMLAGLDLNNVDIPYSDNVLPALEVMLQESPRPFQVVIENGYVKEVRDLPAGLASHFKTRKVGAAAAKKPAAKPAPRNKPAPEPVKKAPAKKAAAPPPAPVKKSPAAAAKREAEIQAELGTGPAPKAKAKATPPAPAKKAPAKPAPKGKAKAGLGTDEEEITF